MVSDFLKPYTLVAVLVVLALAAGGVLVYGKTQYDKGHAVASAQAVLQVAKEREAERVRQTQANAEAQAASLADIARLSLENAALKQIMKDNANAADLDPDASRACLGADSVRRLNSIR